MTSRNKKAMYIALIAGILLIIAGMSGITLWGTIKDFITNYVVDNSIVQFIFAILIFIASLGGVAVIIGGLLIGKNQVRIGRFFISLGAGVSLIGLLCSVAVTYAEGNLVLGSYSSLGSIGLILSVIARVFTKKE